MNIRRKEEYNRSNISVLMGLTKSTTTQSTIVCSVLVAFLVLAMICSTLPSCHARTEPNKVHVVCKPMDPCVNDKGCKAMCVGPNKVHMVCKPMDPCVNDKGCEAMCVGMGMPFWIPLCKGSIYPMCCCVGPQTH
ncbi:hypothetical protein CFC21_044092 [Triticum aestivum]|uniref:Uncharacterized protein n=2 Tax=Triticum aestivum TaxID=4565 RepID=A0A3B6G0N5_WHEAT|nr:hypothetical protein CFC21_044092 [Triticum aestivum]